MTRTFRTLAGALLVTLAPGGGDAAAQAPPIVAQLTQPYVEAFNAKDATRFAALFAEDAVLMPPETPIIRGRAAVEAAYRGRFALDLGYLRMDVLDFETHGDRATAVGTFTLTRAAAVSAGGAAAPAAAGKYIQVFKRVDGRWLIAYQIVNYDAPMSR